MTGLNISSRLARRAQGKEPSPIRALFPLLSVPGMISFGGGYPNPETFPFTGMELFFGDELQVPLKGSRLGPALQYGPSDSDPLLRDLLLDWHKRKDGFSLSGENLVVLNGSQEGLFISAYLFLEKDDGVALSEPTYPGALSAFRAFTRNFLPVPLDGDGMDTRALERTLQELALRGEKLPKLIYTIPNGHNPGGVALSPERRTHLIEIARTFDLLVLEDDPYQLIRLEDTPPADTLQSLDEAGRVIRLDSFSKILAPGLRLGYASGSPEVMDQFLLFKQSANLHTATLGQRILAAYLEAVGSEGFLRSIREICQRYRINRDVMVEAAGTLLPPDTAFHLPREGFFIWFRLPAHCRADRMVETHSRDLKVLLVPGPAFSSRGGCRSCMRASFSMVDRDRIGEGMERFARMIRSEGS